MSLTHTTGSQSSKNIISVPPKAVERAKEFTNKQIQEYGIDIRDFQSDVRTIERVYTDVLFGKLGEMAVAYIMAHTYGHYVKLDFDRRAGGDIGDLLHFDGSTPPVKVDVKTVSFGHKWLLVPVRQLTSDWYIAVECFLKRKEIVEAKGEIKFRVYDPVRRSKLAVRDEKGRAWFLFFFDTGSHLLNTTPLMMVPESRRKPIHIEEVRQTFEKQARPNSEYALREKNAGIPLNWLTENDTQSWEEFIREFYPNPPEYGKQQGQGK
jgi:hypothetical protein